MSKELKIKGNLSKDYQQIYIDDEPIGVYLNEEGKVKLKDIVVSGELKASQEALVIKNNSDGNGSDIKTDGSLTLDPDGDIILDPESGITKFYKAGDTDDLCTLTVAANGATTIATSDSDGTAGHLILDPNGALQVSGAHIQLDTTKGIYFDGTSGETYIYESGDDILRVVVGGDIIMHITENGDDGNQTYFADSSVGFQQKEPTYNASATDVDFRHSNKQNLTFNGGSITNINLFFPTMSGNFQLLVKQDGTGSRTITNYKVYEFDESLADGETAVKWAGGLAEGGPSGSSLGPNLTDDANHVDILSFYWDADNEIAYGVATLDFQF